MNISPPPNRLNSSILIIGILFLFILATSAHAQRIKQNDVFFVSTPGTVARVGDEYVYDIIVAGLDPSEGKEIYLFTDGDWLSLVDNGDLTARLSGVPAPSDLGTKTTIVLQVGKNLIIDLTVQSSIYIKDAQTTSISTVPSLIINEEDGYNYEIELENFDPANPPSIFLGLNPNSTIPQWLTINDFKDGTARLSGVPDDAAVGYTNVILTISDFGVILDQQTFTIDVLPVNDDPSFVIPFKQTAHIDDLYRTTIMLKDVDQTDTLTISAIEKPNWLNVTDQGDGSILLEGTPMMTDIGENAIRLLGEDGNGGSDTLDFTITVSEFYMLYMPLIQK